VKRCTRPSEALESIVREDFDAIVASLDFEGLRGIEFCGRASEARPDVPVLVSAAAADLKLAVLAMRAGAVDFVAKPLTGEDMMAALHRAVERACRREGVSRLADDTEIACGPANLVGSSPAMREVYDLIHRISATDASVLVTGESGTGKELVARAVHEESARRQLPFVAVNCAAMPAGVLESELFGHVKGAFTDAKVARKGLFEQGDGGTVLLDEIGEMPLEMQPKLLRVLQEKQARPVGGNREVAFDTRVIAATNNDLDVEVAAGRFREDLFYRLNVVQIHVPPLRVRGADILLLAQHFLAEVAARLGKPVRGISGEAKSRLLSYDWPGNVRQLENSIERAVTLARFDQLTVEDLPHKIRRREGRRTAALDAPNGQLPSLREVEMTHIKRVLRAVAGNKTQAAKVLGLDRRTLYRKLERYEERRSQVTGGH